MEAALSHSVFLQLQHGTLKPGDRFLERLQAPLYEINSKLMLPNPEIHHLNDLPVYIRDNFMCRRRNWIQSLKVFERACAVNKVSKQCSCDYLGWAPNRLALRDHSGRRGLRGNSWWGLATAAVGHRANDRAGRTRFLREFGGNDEIVVG
jgi:hypothetical protein